MIIDPVAASLNIDRENVFANTIIFDENGIFSVVFNKYPSLEFLELISSQGDYRGFDYSELTSESGGKGKVIEVLKQKYGYQNVVMIGDGATDLETCPPAVST